MAAYSAIEIIVTQACIFLIVRTSRRFQ